MTLVEVSAPQKSERVWKLAHFWQGRINRATYVVGQLIVSIMAVAMFIVTVLTTGNSLLALFVLFAMSLVSTISLCIRRGHDLRPLKQQSLAYRYLVNTKDYTLSRGESGSNRYGPPPH